MRLKGHTLFKLDMHLEISHDYCDSLSIKVLQRAVTFTAISELD